MAKYSDEHWASVADVYFSADRAPALAVAEKFGVPVPTARRWFMEMRRRGQLPVVPQGRNFVEHLQITRVLSSIAQELGVDRHALAAAIRLHAPDGRLHVGPVDAREPRCATCHGTLPVGFACRECEAAA